LFCTFATTGQVFQHPVISLDVMSTITALAGVDGQHSAELPLDGVNLVPFLQGIDVQREPDRSGAPHAQLFWMYANLYYFGPIALAWRTPQKV
jgi:hypothetical protein